MSNNEPVIRAKGLDVIYGQGKSNEVKALKNINLEIYPGEFIIFFGPSGCGKSTLLYSISGLELRAQGGLEVCGHNLIDMSDAETEILHQTKIGMIFQAYYLIYSLSVLKNVTLPQMAVGGSTKIRDKKAMELLTTFGVGHQASKLPNDLSGGQQQRVAICRSLMNDPEILMADEPTGNLDSKSAEEVMQMMKDLNDKDKKTIILVTHNPAHLSLAHRVFYLKDGEIVKVVVNKAINEEVKKEEIKVSISKELELLARVFSSISQAGSLLIPFKAKEIVSEVLTKMTIEEVGLIEKKVQTMLLTGVFNDITDVKYFDDDTSLGGLGLDKRTAENMYAKIKDIVAEIKSLELAEKTMFSIQEADRKNEITQVRQYLFDSFELEIVDTYLLGLIDQAIGERLRNEIDRAAFINKLGLRRHEGGVGMDKRTAKKFGRRLELLMLGKLK